MADRLVVLREGRVQQIGTPEELHTRPANSHVADFMGFRNLVPMQVVATGDGAMVSVQAAGARLEATAVEQVGAGDDVLVGIRPDDLTISAPDATADTPNALRATVEIVEYQGRDLAIEVVTEQGLRLHVRSGHRAAPGDAVIVSAHPDQVLVFRTPSSGRVAPATGEPGLAPVLAHSGGATP